MSDRKAVIKNADMSEEMQQDAVDCATQVNRNEKSKAYQKNNFLKHPTWIDKYDLFYFFRHWKNTILKRILLLTSKRSSTKSTIQRGIVLSDETLVHTSHMKHDISSISTWDKLPSFYLKVDRSWKLDANSCFTNDISFCLTCHIQMHMHFSTP